MKKWKIWLLGVLLTGLVTACDHNAAPDPISAESTPASPSTETSQPSSEGDEPQGTEAEDDSRPPREGMVRSRLTNEWVDAETANIRPLAVMIPNEKAALPQYNLSKAQVLYEANVEGQMTRLLAIIEDWQDLEKIGNIRSLRLYYAYWAFEWDAFLVHFGGPFYINDLMAQETTESVDGNLSVNEAAFFRTSDREMPHNAFANGRDLREAIDRLGYSLNYRGLSDEQHFQFASKAEPNDLSQYSDAVVATYIDMTNCYPQTRCRFEYNPGDGLYYRFQHVYGTADGPHMDGATGEQLCFKNVIVQFTKHEDLGEGYLAFQCHDTTRDGWYFTNGRGIHIHWEKLSDYGATRYYDDNGDEIVLNTGKTMICIVEDGDSFLYQ